MAKDPDPEFEAFKCFDLRSYAAAQGYRSLRRRSSDANLRRSEEMVHDNGDKIIIRRDTDDHYLYFSVHQNHSGTIIDLVKHLKGLSLGRTRQELRPYIGRRQSPSPSLPLFEPLLAVPKNLIEVAREYERMEDAPAHPYLIEVRGIPAPLLSSPRFEGLIKKDRYGNAVFPHFNENGLCGFEKKNKNFTGFAAGGEKGLGISHDFEDDNCIVFTESSIEYLSYAALFPNERARYRSVGGALNPKQPALIREAIGQMREGSEVTAAMNNDDTGHRLAEVVHLAVIETGRADVRFRLDEPPFEQNDWNEVLKPSGPLTFCPVGPDEPR